MGELSQNLIHLSPPKPPDLPRKPEIDKSNYSALLSADLFPHYLDLVIISGSLPKSVNPKKIFLAARVTKKTSHAPTTPFSTA